MFVKKLWSLFAIISSLTVFSQHSDSINEQGIRRVLNFLASDELKGRVNHTKQQLVAAEFLADQFDRFGLSPFPGFHDYYQPFYSTSTPHQKMKLTWNHRAMSSYSYLFLSGRLLPVARNLSDYQVVASGSALKDSILAAHWSDSGNVLIWIHEEGTPGGTLIPPNMQIPRLGPSHDILIVAAVDEPTSMKIYLNDDFLQDVLYNVVAVVPGRSRADEAIVFSAHYDNVSSSYGANDDASGTAAVIELARYFSQKNENERTLIFCLFAGEELGLLGSQAFVQNINPANIIADINIEMIGATSWVGKNSFVLTGSDRSDLYTILKNHLRNGKVKVFDCSYDPRDLFGRSDNQSFFQKRIVAHSIMCSDDNDPCYHQPCDKANRIDFKNMTEIIRAIAKSCETLIDGTDTPRITPAGTKDQ